MTVLCDWEIQYLCLQKQMVWPFAHELLNPASLDVVLGPTLMIEIPEIDELQRYDISAATKENPYWLRPSEFVLAETLETFHLPDEISAQFVLKSSRAREGYNNLLAGWCDPGWHGSKLTLELQNCRKFVDLPLYPNLKIGQMVFHKMSNMPLHNYATTGRYNLHQTVMGSEDAKTT